MNIFIPSKARAEQKHHTFDGLPPDVQRRTRFVVGPQDAPAYMQRFGEDHVLITDAKGIGPVRQHIIEISDGPVLMLDDDLSFFVRRRDDATKLLKASPANVRAMAHRMESALGRYAHAGVAAREGANRNTTDVLYDTRMLRALGYDASVLKREGVRFDRVPVMEDFDVALQLLRLGYHSLTLNCWAQDQGTSNAPGGCSTYRTPAVQAKGAHALHKLHPDFVTVVQKETKGAWGGGVRTDVRVAWKKAFNDAAK